MLLPRMPAHVYPAAGETILLRHWAAVGCVTYHVQSNDIVPGLFRGWAGSSPRPPQAFPSPSVRLPDISSAPPQRLRSSTLACARPRPDQWLNLGPTTSARRAQRHCSDRIDAVVLTPRLNRDYSSLDDGLLLISPSSKHERIRGPRDPCESSPSWSPFRPASAPCSHLVFTGDSQARCGITLARVVRRACVELLLFLAPCKRCATDRLPTPTQSCAHARPSRALHLPLGEGGGEQPSVASGAGPPRPYASTSDDLQQPCVWELSSGLRLGSVLALLVIR